MADALALIVNYFSADSVVQLVESIAEHRGDCRVTVSVYDNSCDTVEWKKLSDSLNGVMVGDRSPALTRSDENLGYAGGNNAAHAAVATAPHEVVFVINPDCVVTRGSFALAVDEIKSHPSTLYGAPTRTGGMEASGLAEISFPTGRAHELTPDSVARPPRRAVRYPSGHFIGMTAEIWDGAGGFSENYFLYSEEADLVLRLEGSGISVGILENIAVSHVGGETTGSGHDERRSAVTLFHAGRSRILLFRAHARLRRWLLPALFSRMIWSLGFLIKGRARDFLSIQRGVWSALRSPIR